MLSTTLAAWYIIARLGVGGTPTISVLRVLAISYWTLLAPAVALCPPVRRTPVGRLLAASPSLTLIAALTLAVLAGFATNLLGWLPSIILPVAGVVFVVLIVTSWWVRTSAGPKAVMLLVSVVFGTWVGAAAWGSGYYDPLFKERLLTHRGAIDTMYYASLAEMIRTYAVSSTGLDGLVQNGTHLGQLIETAGLSDLSSIDALTFYSLGYPIILLPLLFQALLSFSLVLSERLEPPGVGRPLTRRPVVWMLFLAANVGFLPRAMLLAASLGHAQIESQSYCLALTLSFLLMAAVLETWPRAASGRSGARAQAEEVNSVILFVAVPMLLTAIAVTKVSLFLLLFAVCSYLIVRLRLHRSPRLVAAYVISGVAGGLGTLFVSAARVQQGYLSLALPTIGFERSPWHTGAFALLYFFWSWVLLLMILVLTRGARGFCQSLDDLKLLHLEMAMVVLVVGLLPTIVIAFPDGSDRYFSDVQNWVSLAVVMGTLPLLDGRFRGPSRALAPMQVLAATACAIVSTSATYNWITQARFAVELNVRTRQNLQTMLTTGGGASPSPWEGNGVTGDFAWGSLIDVPRLDIPRVRQLREYQLMQALQEVAEMPRHVRQKTMVLVPRSNHTYWNLLSCGEAPFLAPALSGAVALYGLPSSDCDLRGQEDYGYYSYDRSEVTDTNPCQRAIGLGFSQVIAIQDSPTDEQSLVTIACDTIESKP